MRIRYIISILLLCCAGSVFKCLAQQSIVTLSEPEEITGETTDKNQSVLMVSSLIENLTIESNMGDTCHTSIPENEAFLYTLNIKFSEDELDGTSAISRIIKVKSEYGEASLKSKFQPGKKYKVHFDVPPEFSYADESVSGGIFASDQAKVTFTSKLSELDLYYNGNKIITAGKISASTLPYITVKQEEDDYNLLFNLTGEHSAQTDFKKPVFKAVHKDENGKMSELIIKLKEGVEIGPKSMLKYRIFYKNVIGEKEIITVAKEMTFDELMAKAQGLEDKQDFEAAKNTYDEAMNHIDCPLDQKENIRKMKQNAEQARKLTFIRSRFENNLNRLESLYGYTGDNDSTYTYAVALVKVNRDLTEVYPDVIEFQISLNKASEKLYQHPKSQMKEEKKEVFYKQVITGNVTKEDSFADEVAGVVIYASSEKKPKMKDTKHMQVLGRVSPNGTYKIMFKPPVSYLYFYGSKEAFPITESTRTLDVTLK